MREKAMKAELAFRVAANDHEYYKDIVEAVEARVVNSLDRVHDPRNWPAARYIVYAPQDASEAEAEEARTHATNPAEFSEEGKLTVVHPAGEERDPKLTYLEEN